MGLCKEDAVFNIKQELKVWTKLRKVTHLEYYFNPEWEAVDLGNLHANGSSCMLTGDILTEYYFKCLNYSLEYLKFTFTISTLEEIMKTQN